MATSCYFYGTSKSEFVKMEGKDDLLIHAAISAMFSLFFLPLSIFFPFLCSFFLNLFYYCFYCGSLFSHFSLPSSNGSFLSPP